MIKIQANLVVLLAGHPDTLDVLLGQVAIVLEEQPEEPIRTLDELRVDGLRGKEVLENICAPEYAYQELAGIDALFYC